MGIFTRKDTSHNPLEADIPELHYENLGKTLSEAIGKGSKDVKRVNLVLENNETIYFVTDTEQVKWAFDETKPLNLIRIFHENQNLTIEEQEKIEKLSNIIPDVEFYEKVLESFPQYEELLNNIIKDYVISVAQTVNHHTIKQVSIDIIFSPMKEQFNNIGFSMSIPDVYSMAKDQDRRINNLEKSLSITYDDYNSMIYEIDDSYISDDSLENAVVEAIRNHNSLLNIKHDFVGYLWADVLNVISDLVWKKKIQINSLEDSEEESLPDFEEDFINISENPTDDNDEWEFAYPPKDDEDDDGDFNVIVQEAEEKKPYKELLSSFIELIDENNEKYEEIKKIVKDYDVKSLQVYEMNDTILPLQNNYDKDVSEFNELAIEKHLNDMNSNVSSDQLLESIDEKRDDSNGSFFELSDLEQSRHIIDKERENDLQKVYNDVSEFNGERVQEFLHIVESLMNDIEETVDKAFFDPREALEESITKNIFQNLDDMEPWETPVYNMLVELYGNPFEKYFNSVSRN